MDIHGAPDSELRMRDSNPGAVRTSPGGVARNIAENLARLGVDCRLLSAVGNDHHGELLLQHGRAAGINMNHVVQMESAQTSTYMSVLDETGDMHVAISDMAILDRLGPEHLRAHKPLIEQAALVAIDTNLNDEALAWLTSTFAKQAFFVDTVSTSKAIKIKPFLSDVHTLKPSLIEAESITGIAARTDSQLPKLAEWFHAQGVERLFISLGERGVFYSTGDAQGTQVQPNDRCEVSNAGGAGDAFLAGLAYAWLNQWEIEKTVGFAQAAASLTLSHEQTNSPELSLAAVTRIYESSHAE
jgi:pseudouridine kinase